MKNKFGYYNLTYCLGLFLPFFVCLIAYELSFSFPAFIEFFYSRLIYPFIMSIFSSITSLFPFSLGEIMLFCLFAFIIIFLLYLAFSIFKKRPLYVFLKRLLIIIVCFSLIYSSFIGLWALNYARLPLSVTLELESENIKPIELYNLCIKLTKNANELRKNVNTNENGVYVTNKSYEEINFSTQEIFNDYAPDFMNLGRGTNVKSINTKNFLSALSITGIYCPFTFECNVNMQMPSLYFGATNIHEYAHFKGFAREDEANFIAYYLGRNSNDTDYSYSATMLALNYALNALYSISTEAHAQIYNNLLSEGIKQDFKNENEYWATFDTPIAQKSTQMNDSYLKSNRQHDGIQSYGRMIDLLIALMRKGDL